MKVHFNKYICLVCLLWAGYEWARADLTIFQQIEDYSLKSNTTPQQTKLYVSGKHLRFDQGGLTSSIILKDKKVTFSIMHQSHQYVVLPHGLVADLTETGNGKGLEDDFQLNVTGKTETIYGFPCREVQITENNGSKSDLWICDQVPAGIQFYREFEYFMEFGSGILPSTFEKHPELKGIPIRVIEYQRDQKLRQSTMIKVETSKIPDSMFEVPAGYEELKIEDQKNSESPK